MIHKKRAPRVKLTLDNPVVAFVGVGLLLAGMIALHMSTGSPLHPMPDLPDLNQVFEEVDIQ